MDSLVAILSLSFLALGLGAILAQASRRLRIVEDPRLAAVLDALPGNNCGACGQAGCRQFAKALTGGMANPGQCTVATPDTRQIIGSLLGVTVHDVARNVARLACAGGTNVAHRIARYLGPTSCRAAATVSGGGHACAWGCLGYGDCEAVCDFDAIHLDEHDLPRIDPERCTACGDCVEVCPKSLFSLEPSAHRLWVACRSRATSDEVLETCQVACTACGRCVLDGGGTIRMTDGLPFVDYPASSADDTRWRNAMDRCPTGAIGWLETDGSLTKGPHAQPIVRMTSIDATPTQGPVGNVSR